MRLELVLQDLGFRGFRKLGPVFLGGQAYGANGLGGRFTLCLAGMGSPGIPIGRSQSVGMQVMDIHGRKRQTPLSVVSYR
jgi:hypothetical protein